MSMDQKVRQVNSSIVGPYLARCLSRPEFYRRRFGRSARGRGWNKIFFTSRNAGELARGQENAEIPIYDTVWM